MARGPMQLHRLDAGPDPTTKSATSFVTNGELQRLWSSTLGYDYDIYPLHLINFTARWEMKTQFTNVRFLASIS